MIPFREAKDKFSHHTSHYDEVGCSARIELILLNKQMSFKGESLMFVVVGLNVNFLKYSQSLRLFNLREGADNLLYKERNVMRMRIKRVIYPVPDFFFSILLVFLREEEYAYVAAQK